jgi:DNA polymerase-1
MSTEAVFIFSNMAKRLLTVQQPDFVVAVFEGEGKTYREQEFAAYKANRSETPPDLIEQLPYVERVLAALNIPVVSAPGYEADDVIGSLARQAVEAGVDAVIVSSDKDLLQLVSSRVSMLNPMKEDLVYDPAKAEEFLGVPPRLIADLLALKGDPIDNIPGAPGIGEKGAKDLLLQFGPVEQLLDRADEVARKSYRESLVQHREQILLSKRLATIDVQAPVALDLEAFRAVPPNRNALRDLYRDLEFFSLLRDLGPEPQEERTKEYRELGSPAEALAYVQEAPGPVAVVVEPVGEGLLVEDQFGLSARPGEGRSGPAAWLPELRSWLEDADRPKSAYDYKSLAGRLFALGIEPHGFLHDGLLYSFLLNPEGGAPGLRETATRDANFTVDAGAGAAADAARELAERLGGRVQERGLDPVYQRIDLPVSPVVAKLERTGVRVDRSRLASLSARFNESLDRLAADIHRLAGKPFNINSPQQLAKILYEDLSLKAPVRYGKGKQMSTAADILEELAEEHEIAGLVLEYRQIAKLKGTYADALPALLDAGQRVHTTFNLAGAATGRLSSSNPNLQNIPIRSELGREIRGAFVPEPDWKLLAADYSQIELRLLAHMSGDPVLVDAFSNHQDIHRRTASEVFGVPPSEVTSDMRRYAKTVNFGIIYGQTSFGLAKQLGISRAEADDFIRRYFATYKVVKEFIDATVARARETGMSETLLGRQRPLPDIKSRNPNARHFAERVAVNAPLQGSAADLIKLAMIRIDSQLQGQGRMLLQVHDELLFEAPPAELDALSALVRREMESVYALRVPLVVDIGIGDNWRDAK